MASCTKMILETLVNDLQERIANYRISRARRIVENAFGISTSRFRVFRKAISANDDTAIEVTKAVVILHNFLMTDWHNNVYCPSNFVDHERNGVFQPGEWREEFGNNAFERM